MRSERQRDHLNPNKKPIVVKATINGKVVVIDIASDDKDSYEDMDVEYLGSGIYHSYDGQPANDDKITHFWKWKKKK